jgi:hypothetical protein
MKKILLASIIMILLGVVEGYSFEMDTTFRTIGFNLYRSSSCGGFCPSLNMSASIEKGRRHLEFGVNYHSLKKGFTGGEVIYRHFFSCPPGKEPENCKANRLYRFFFQYNFVFRQNNGLSVFQPAFGLDHSNPDGVRVATFEHYAGGGVQVMVFNGIYLSGVLGYGIVLGSVDEKFMNERHYTEGGRKTDSGMSTRFGIGYFFNR